MRPAAGLLALLVAGAVVVGCAGSEPAPERARALAGTSWVCVAIEGEPVQAGADVTLEWEREGRLGGHTGVNRWFGAWQGDGGSAVTFSGLGATRRAGPPELMKQETRFLDTLVLVEQVHALDGGLQLFGRNRLLLEFRPQER